MSELFFLCRGAESSDNTLVYHEPPRKESQEEFFCFFQAVSGAVDELLRNIFREAISISRLGHPRHYFTELMQSFSEMAGSEEIDNFEEKYRIVIGIARGSELFLLRSANMVLRIWREEKGLEIGDGAWLSPEVITLSAERRQTELFEKRLEDLFILERFLLGDGVVTMAVLPSAEFFERNRERLMDTIFFPGFDPSKEAQEKVEWSALSFCGVHWNASGEAEVGKTGRRKKSRMKLPLPLAAGIVTAIVAFAIFFYPTRRRAVNPERPKGDALLIAHNSDSSKSALSVPSEGEGEVNRASSRSSEKSGSFEKKKISLEVAWTKKFSKPVTSSPTVFEGKVVFGCRDGNLYCFNEIGNLLWKYDSHSGIGASPVVAGKAVFCANYSGKVFSIAGDTGRELWVFDGGEKIVSSPRVHNNLIVTGTVKGTFFALDRKNGKLKWRKKLGLGIWANSYAGKDFIAVATMDGSLVKLTYDGDILWKVNLDRGILSSPISIEKEDKIIFGCKDGYIYCYSTSDGKLLWRFKASGEVNGAPAYSDGIVVVGSRDGALYALDTNGRLKWKKSLSKPILSKPLLLNGLVLVTSYDSALYAIDGKSGEVIKRFMASSPIYSSCISYGGKIFFGSNKGDFYALLLYD